MDPYTPNYPLATDSRDVADAKIAVLFQQLQEGINWLIAQNSGGVTAGGPTASFVLTQPASLQIAVDASASTGTGLTYAWAFGDTTTGTGVTTTHTYGAGGNFIVTLTVTDSNAKTATYSLPVTVQTASGGAYTQDSGQGTNSGAQVTGSQYTLFNTSGTDFGAQASAAGSGKILSLPASTQAKLKGFTSSVLHAADITAGGGVIGAGSDVSIIEQAAGASTGPSTQGNTTSNELVRVTTPGALLQDFQILGTTQSVAVMHGVSIRAGGVTVRRVKLINAGPGNDKAPPGETFGLSFNSFSGGMLVEDVEIDGQGKGASNFGTNGGAGGFIGDYTVNRLYTHDNWYSGGIALWQQIGNAVFNDCVWDKCRCFWNIERCTGTVTINRPRIGVLKAATSGWANGAAPATGIYCETDNTWTGAHPGTFLFKVVDPRNLDGTPYTGPKLGISFGGHGADGGQNLYGTKNFKAYSAAGADISSSFFTYGGVPGPGI